MEIADICMKKKIDCVVCFLGIFNTNIILLFCYNVYIFYLIEYIIINYKFRVNNSSYIICQ